MNSDARLALVVTLTVRRGAVSQFREFERHAARIMSRHGGAIERTVVESENDATDVFREIHIVSFPDQSAFAAYRTD